MSLALCFYANVHIKGLPVIGRIVVGIERNEAYKLCISKSKGANSLASTKRVYLCIIGHFQMLDRLPMESLMAIERAPLEFTQSSQ